MPRRRVEVTVDLNVGNLNLPSAPVEIDATVAGGGGGGTGGGGGGGGGGLASAVGWAATLRNILGPGMGGDVARMILRLNSLWKVFMAGLSALGPIGIAVLAGLAAAFGAVFLQVKWSISIVTSLAKAIWGGIVAAVEGAIKGIGQLATAIWDGLVNALQAGVDWGLKLAETIGQKVVEAIGTAISYYAELEQSLANATAVTGTFGDAGLKMRQELMDIAEQVSTFSSFTSVDIAKGMYEIESSIGGSVEQIKGMSTWVAILADATQSEFVPTAELMVNTMNQFQLSMDQAARIANVFTSSINKSPGTMAKLTKAMQYAGPTAYIFGNSLEQTVAALQGLFTMGRTGSMAGTELSNIFNSLVKQTDKARAAFNKYGVDLRQLDPTRTGIIDIVEMLEKVGQKFGQGAMVRLIGESFELRTIRGLNALISIGSTRLRQMQRDITGTDSAWQTMQDQLNTIQGSWKLLINVWNMAQTALMKGGLGAAVRDMIGLFKEWLIYLEKQGVFQRFGAIVAWVFGIIGQRLNAAAPTIIAFINWVLDKLPGAINAAIAFVEQVIAAFAEGGKGQAQAFVDLFYALANAAVRLLFALPTLIPYFAKLAERATKVVNALATMQVDMRPMLDLAIGLVDRFTALVFWLFAAGQDAMPKLYSWFVYLWAMAQPALKLIIDMVGNFFQLVEGLGPLLILLAVGLIPLTTAVGLLVGLGGVLLLAFSKVVQVVALAFRFVQWLTGADWAGSAADWADSLSKGAEAMGKMAFNTAGAAVAAPWAAAKLGAGLGPIGQAGQAAAARAQEIRVNLDVPPDWEALKVAFGQWADRMKTNGQVGNRVAGPDNSPIPWAPLPPSSSQQAAGGGGW